MAADSGELLVFHRCRRQAGVLRLRRDFIDIGGDYTLLDQQGTLIGHIDGRVFSIGGHWKGRVRNEHKSAKKLLAVMKLFCAVIIFNGQNRRHVKRLAGTFGQVGLIRNSNVRKRISISIRGGCAKRPVAGNHSLSTN